MRICLVVSGRNELGGVERHLVDLANGLSQEFEVHVIADFSFSDQFNSAVWLHPVPFTLSRFSPRLLVAVSRAIKGISPDLIHAHGNKAARVLTLIDRQHTVPRILTVHNTKPVQQLCERFDRIITVTTQIKSQIQHPSVTTILNGRG